LGPALILQQKT